MADYTQYINNASAQYGVPADIIRAIMQVENASGNPNAVGTSGEKGLMQIMPSNFNALGLTNPFDPQQNINAGTKLLKQLLDASGGDMQTAIKKYNAGKYFGGSQAQKYYDKVLAAYKGISGADSVSQDALGGVKNPPEGGSEDAKKSTDKAWYERAWDYVLETIGNFFIEYGIKIVLGVLAILVIVFGVWKLINS